MISIVCPVFNEEESVSQFVDCIVPMMRKQRIIYEVVFIDDGSTDSTLSIILNMKKKNEHIRVISFSRNFGKEAALTAGLKHARGNAVIPIDADLQDPPELILDMMDQWEKGYEVVLAKRVDRSSDGLAKRLTAKIFYKVHNRFANDKIPENVGDYRLMDRKVVDAINLLPERQRFMKGIFSWVGFNTTTLNYRRSTRIGGKSKFSIFKLWNLALEAITSFSTIPLKFWSYIGAFISFVSFVYGGYIVARTLLYGVDVPGYASLIVIVLFLGGAQLIGIGVLGEYISRIYMETKLRPLYIIDKEY